MTKESARDAHINSERVELLRRYDKGEPVDQGPLLDALTWRMGNQRREIARLSRPYSEREPPHCPTCSCGMDHEPEAAK
jgi:hypothetical protein